MDRETELQLLIEEQARDMRYGDHVYDPCGAVSLSAPRGMGGMTLEDYVDSPTSMQRFPGRIQGQSCPVHGYSRMSLVESEGRYRCLECERERGAQRRRAKGVAERRKGCQVHGLEAWYIKHYPNQKYPHGYCRTCNSGRAKAYRQRPKEMSSA